MSERPTGTPEVHGQSTMTDADGQLIQTTSGQESVRLDRAAGEPFAVIGDQTFGSQEELTKAWNERNSGADSVSGADSASGTDTLGTGGEDTLKGGQGNDVVARTDEEIKASLKEAGGVYADPKYEPFALEFEKTGALAPDSVTAAAAAFGISEDFVKEFVAGQAAKRTLATTEASSQATQAETALATAITSVVESDKDYTSILDWGREHLSKEDQAAYNSALDRKDGTTAAALLKSFKAGWAAAGNGKGPRDITQEGASQGSGGGVQGYASKGEQQAAMADPRYEKDAGYRAEVAAKVAKSTF